MTREPAPDLLSLIVPPTEHEQGKHDRVPYVGCPVCNPPRVPEPPTLPDPTASRPGIASGKHPQSSHRAAQLVAPRTGTQRGQALDALYNAADGLTAAQVAPFLNRSRNQTAVRLGELRRDGWVDYLRNDAGNVVERPTDANGNVGDVQVLTGRGRILWAEHREES